MKYLNYFIPNENKLFKTIIIALYIVIFILILFINSIFIAIVDGSSMENTIHDNDILIINKKAYSLSPPKRYDIVNIYAKDKYDNFLVKRIIGLPGDTLEINNSSIYLNGTLLHEDYIKENMQIPYYIKINIPKNKYFVMGDNRNVSLDSRYFGLIKESDIQGKALLKFCSKTKKLSLF